MNNTNEKKGIIYKLFHDKTIEFTAKVLMVLGIILSFYCVWELFFSANDAAILALPFGMSGCIIGFSRRILLISKGEL